MGELHQGPGVLLIELPEDGGEPLGGHAGEDAHPEEPTGSRPGHLAEVVLHGLDLLHDLQERGPGLGEGHPPLVPVEELDAQLVLDVVDDVSQAGLGVAQHVGRPGEGAALGGFDDGEISAHGARAPFRQGGFVRISL